MIIVRLIGGLGNQLFQYAAGKRLAHFHHSELYIDVTGFASYPLRKFELNIFNIKAEIASSVLLKKVSFTRKDMLRSEIRHLLFGESRFRVIKEKNPSFCEKILNLPDNVYLDGYWQSEKYFTEIADILRSEFSFLKPPSAINKELLKEIQGCNSVSLHIRRGDYVSNQKIANIMEDLGIDHYIRALNLMEELIEYPDIYIFSDDINWVKKNIRINLPLHYIEHNRGEMNYEDLRLMSNCKHHIIANSSFSWWGAWLGKNSKQIVIAPGKWFTSVHDSDIDSRIPKEWIIINS